MTTVLGTGTGVPDVVTIVINTRFPAASDLRDLIARDKVDINQYAKTFFDSRCRYGERIIGLPITVGATMYFYNKAMFDAKVLKYPEWGYTMQQWMDDAVKMTDRSKKIFGAAMPTRIWRSEFFAFGASPISDDGKRIEGFVNGPRSVMAFEFMVDLVNSGAVLTKAEFGFLRTEGTGPIDLFSTGRLGFAGLNNGQFEQVDKAGVKCGRFHNPAITGEDIITNAWTSSSRSSAPPVTCGNFPENSPSSARSPGRARVSTTGFTLARSRAATSSRSSTSWSSRCRNWSTKSGPSSA